MLDNIYPKPQEITLDIDRGLSIIVYFRRNAVIFVSTSHKLLSHTIHPTLELAECPERRVSLDFWQPTHNDVFESVLVPPGNLVLQYTFDH